MPRPALARAPGRVSAGSPIRLGPGAKARRDFGPRRPEPSGPLTLARSARGTPLPLRPPPHPPFQSKDPKRHSITTRWSAKADQTQSGPLSTDTCERRCIPPPARRSVRPGSLFLCLLFPDRATKRRSGEQPCSLCCFLIPPHEVPQRRDSDHDLTRMASALTWQPPPPGARIPQAASSRRLSPGTRRHAGGSSDTGYDQTGAGGVYLCPDGCAAMRLLGVRFAVGRG